MIDAHMVNISMVQNVYIIDRYLSLNLDLVLDVRAFPCLLVLNKITKHAVFELKYYTQTFYCT